MQGATDTFFYTKSAVQKEVCSKRAMVQSFFTLHPESVSDANGIFIFDGLNFLFTLPGYMETQNMLNTMARAT